MTRNTMSKAEKEKAAFTLLTTVAVLIDCKVPESQARLWLKTAYLTVRNIRGGGKR